MTGTERHFLTGMDWSSIFVVFLWHPFLHVCFICQQLSTRFCCDLFFPTPSEGKIPNLLSEGSVDNMTKLVLVNAIYFKGNWAEKFKEADTTDMPFRLNKVIQICLGSIYLTKWSNNNGAKVKLCLQIK